MEIVLLLFSALLTTVVALECEFCSSSTGNTCSGHYEICQSSDSRCRVTLTETTLGNIRSAVLEKSCGSVYNCTHPPSLTTNGYQVRVSTVCCDTDHCNIGTVNLSPVNDTLNGESCPSCFARDSDQCEMQTVVNCTGEEHKIYHHNGWLRF
ncbi:hypothetical protein GDO86_012186 [Hymenochirus boettgeri]|uniref:UPAR/Ly6 domain-containing protein n=1 Tax=Hymenochirus boettgeri TaxID=247094 RepID=A0A8T2IP27_9PIPI|nr:hypothetical protein GDO86_012186 [Hymenochirus boettgeri]